MSEQYRYYCEVFKGRPMPFAFVDLDCFDRNADTVLKRAGDMPVCIASKSVRCAALLKRLQARASQFHSILAYSAREAVYLCNQGFDNIIVAYPVWGEAAVSQVVDVIRAGKTLALMVDCVEQVELLDALGRENDTVIPLCMDVDMSSRYPGLHFGVLRSPIATPAQAVALWEHIRRCDHVRLDGVMGYEAQIAGVQDTPPASFLKNQLVRVLKKRSIRELAARRAAVVQALQDAGCTLRFVNGGGTGSIESTIREQVVTEVTVGSGFYSPALFDHYAQFKHEPAAGFAIEIVRKPAPTTYTCQGGGYVASGAAGPDKLPKPWLPTGARLTANEGAGEVQTPVVYEGPEPLRLGAPIFMRHAKGGELCERFNTLLLVSDGDVVDEVNTYRGDGLCFL